MNLNKIAFICLSIFFFFSCMNSDLGELQGSRIVSNWSPDRPTGMSLIKSGVFVMGSTDENAINNLVAPAKTVSISAFFMDETEISNNEYRQFVNWVRDSVIRYKLAMKSLELGYGSQEVSSGQNEELPGIAEYVFLPVDTIDNPYNKYLIDNYGDNDTLNFKKKLNWEIDLIWDFKSYPDIHYAEVMDSMYVSLTETYDSRRMIDVNKLKYEYNEREIAASKRFGSKRKYYTKEIMVYPDTLVWLRDFTYSYNEPMQQNYFWHVAYDEYPVVGVTWDQANAFCNWRTKYKNAYQSKKGMPSVSKFRLPTETEWEYAARGGLNNVAYPWGGPYLKDEKGCFLANFKPLRGNYMADGSLYTAKVNEYPPNDFNLYNMSGNVAEWTSSLYDPNSYTYILTFNPQYGDGINKNKFKDMVVRGGSWKDVSYYLQVGTRDYEHKDSCTSYIGFRTVQTYLGVEQQ